MKNSKERVRNRLNWLKERSHLWEGMYSRFDAQDPADHERRRDNIIAMMKGAGLYAECTPEGAISLERLLGRVRRERRDYPDNPPRSNYALERLLTTLEKWAGPAPLWVRDSKSAFEYKDQINRELKSSYEVYKSLTKD